MVVPTQALLQDAIKRFMLKKSISPGVRNIHSTSFSSDNYAYCAFINIFKKQPVSMENSSLISGGLISIVFVELGMQSSLLSRTTQEKIWFFFGKNFLKQTKKAQ